MEGLGYNPVVYSLLSDLLWDPSARDLDTWIAGYALSRYGREFAQTASAWRKLLQTAYRTPARTSSVICRRPTLSPNIGVPPYNPNTLLRAFDELLECSAALSAQETYQYDVVHIARQILSNLASTAHHDIVTAFQAKDHPALATACQAFMELLSDMDTLLATRSEFLLGRWIEDARRWATDEEDRARIEWNARTQITLWGPPRWAAS